MKLTKTRVRRVVNSLAAGLILAWQLAAPMGASADQLNPNTQEQKVTICHRTDSYTNPYVEETVAQSSVDGNTGNDNGQGDHYAEHQGPIFYTTIPKHTEWGDIIPAIEGVTPGLNWTDGGKSLLRNHCDPDRGDVKVNKKVDTDGNGTFESGNDTANLIGFRWSLDDETPARQMGTTADDVIVGAHTVTENSINGYAFKGWYAGEGSCSDPDGTTLPVSIDVKKKKTTTITLCNQAQKGSITIVKDAQPNGDEAFGFNIDKQGSGLNKDFSLVDNNTDSNTTTFSDLTLGSYDVTEDTASDWVLSDISCSEGADVVVNKDNGKVTITLHPGDAVTCTFTNQEKGKIRVYKHTDPAGDDTQFSVEATGDGTIFGNATQTIKDGEYKDFVVTQGTYTVDENDLPDGWSQIENTCKDLVINQDNLFQTCDITNTKGAQLKIVKEANPANGQEFNFTSSELENFTLVGNNDEKDNSATFGGLQAGDYSVAEEATNGWKLANLWCDGTENFSVDGSKVTVSIKAGDNVTCTFVNNKLNTIKGHKFEDVNGNGEWDEGEPGIEGWTIQLTKDCEEVPSVLSNVNTPINSCGDPVTTKTDENGAYSFGDLEPGAYTVCEVQQDGWVQTFPWDEENSQCYTVFVEGPGQTVWCKDFGNFRLGSVEGVKFNDVNGNHQRDEGEPTLKNWVITLTNVCPAENDNEDRTVCVEQTQTTKTDEDGAYSFSGLMPGDYKVCEVQQANWTQTFPQTEDGCHLVTITGEESGQVVTADFGNKAKPQVLSETTTKLVNTGASTTKGMLVGMTILSTVLAVHFLTVRRKDYAK